jgi:hypothetical protein
LYYRDLNGTYGGTNYNGWAVNLTTANPVGLSADTGLYENTTVNSQNFGNATNVTATPGSLWHITLAVTNYGPSISSNLFVADTPPQAPGVTLVSSNTTLGSITSFGGTLVWNVTTNNVTTNYLGALNTNCLAVNAGGTLTLTFQANSTGVYTNSAAVSAATTDPNPDDASVMVIATVANTPAPGIVPRFAVGGGKSFQLSITNDAGDNIVISASTNLITWVPVFTNIAPFTFTNFDTTNYHSRFYRAMVQQP